MKHASVNDQIKRKADIAFRIFLAIVLVSTMVILPRTKASAEAPTENATLAQQAQDVAATEDGTGISAEGEDAAAATGEGSAATENATDTTSEGATAEGANAITGSEQQPNGTTAAGTAGTDTTNEQDTTTNSDQTPTPDSPLATLLANIASAGENAAATVTLRAGDHNATATFNGGWLADEATAWTLFDTYAANQTAQGKAAPAANASFKPGVDATTITAAVTAAAPTAADTAFASTLFTAVTANNTYTSASIENADATPVLDEAGNTAQVIALGTLATADGNTEIRYILNDGTEATLTEGQTVVLNYGLPTDGQLNAAQAAAEAAAETDATAEGNPAAEGDGNNSATTEAESETTDAATDLRYADLIELLTAAAASNGTAVDNTGNANAASRSAVQFLGLTSVLSIAGVMPSLADGVDAFMGEAAVEVTAKTATDQLSEDQSSDATFAGGALMQQESMYSLLPGFQEELEQAVTDSEATATLTSEQENFAHFEPEVILDAGAPEALATSVDDGMYLNANVVDEEGETTPIIAAATIDGQVRYATEDGTVSNLLDTQSIQLMYASPNTFSDNQAAAANATLAANSVPTPTFQSIGQTGVIRFEKDGSLTNTNIGFEYDPSVGKDGTINANTAPAAGSLGVPANSYFRAAYVYIAATQARYQIDWLAQETGNGPVHYRLHNASGSGSVVVSSTLGTNDYIIFSYESQQSQREWTITKGVTNSTAVQSMYPGENPTWRYVPSSVTGTFTIQAERIPGTTLYLRVDNDGSTRGNKIIYNISNNEPGLWTILNDAGVSGFGVYRGNQVEGTNLVQWTITPNPNLANTAANNQIKLTLVSAGIERTETMGVRVISKIAGAPSGGGTFGIGSSGTVAYPGKTLTSNGGESASGTAGSPSWVKRVSSGAGSTTHYAPGGTNTNEKFSWTRQARASNNYFRVSNLYSYVGNNSTNFQKLASIYLTYEDKQVWQTSTSSTVTRTVAIPFASSTNSWGTNDTIETELTQGDLKGTRVTVQRINEDNWSLGNANVGYAEYSISLSNLRVSVDIHLDYYTATSASYDNTRVSIGGMTGVAAGQIVMPGGTTSALTNGGLYAPRIADGSRQVTIRLRLNDNYYEPSLRITGVNNSQRTVKVPRKNFTDYYNYEVTFNLQSSEVGAVTTVEILTSQHNFTVSKSAGTHNNQTVSWSWPGNTEPIYSSYAALNKQNSTLIISNAVPTGTAGNTPVYFDHWAIQGNQAINQKFYPGERVNIFDSNRIRLAEGSYNINLVAVWRSAPQAGDPVNATYSISTRQNDRSYSTTTHNVLMANGQHYEITGYSQITEGVNDVWTLDRVTGNTEGTFSTGTTLPSFYYEHNQTIKFMTDSTPEGPGGGGNTSDDLDGVTQDMISGTAPADSSGYSWDTVVLTPAGAFPVNEDGTINESILNFTPAYTLPGYQIIGWRGTGSDNLFLFDPTGYEINPTTGLSATTAATDVDGNPNVAVIERQWGTMNLEPVWAEAGAAYVTFSLEGAPEGMGIGSGSSSTAITEANQYTFTYPVTGGVIGEIPVMKDRTADRGSRVINMWPTDSSGSTAISPNYIAGWTARTADGTTIVVNADTAIMDLENPLGEEITYTSNGTQTTVTSYVLEPIWMNRSFDAGLGTSTTAIEDATSGGTALNGTVANTSETVSGLTLTRASADGTEWNLSGTIAPQTDSIHFQPQIVLENLTNAPARSDYTGNLTEPTNTALQARVVATRKSGANASLFWGNINGKSFFPANNAADPAWGNGSNTAAYQTLTVAESGNTASLPINLYFSEDAASMSGTYEVQIPVTIDAGPNADGWNYTKSITLNVSITVQENEWDFNATDIDYVNEYIQVEGADASGATVEGATGVTSVPQNGQVSLTASLDEWAKDGVPTGGSGESTVTIRRGTGDNGFYKEKSIPVTVPHRPIAPVAGDGGNMTINNNVMEADSQSQSNGSIVITQRGTETYQYRQGTSGTWQDVGPAVDGVFTISNLGNATNDVLYQVRVAPVDNGSGAIDSGNFASAPTSVTIERRYPIHYEFVMDDAFEGDLRSFVQGRLQDYANNPNKTEDNRNMATAAISVLFGAPNATIKHDASLAGVRNYWVPLRDIMSGYNFTVTVQTNNEDPVIYTERPSNAENPHAMGETTITYTWTRSSGVINYDYNFSDGVLDGHFRSDLANPNLWTDATFTVAPGQALSEVTTRENSGTEDRVGGQLVPTYNGWSFSALRFWDAGYKFEGWWTGEGTNASGVVDPTADGWGIKVDGNTFMRDILPDGDGTTTLYARWAQVNYGLTGSATSNQTYLASGNYQPITGTLTVTGNQGTTAADGSTLGVANPRVRELRITQVTGPNNVVITDANTIAQYFTLDTTASADNPTTVGNGMNVTVQPVANANMVQGTWTATVSIGYDGGADGSSLDFGENVYTIDAAIADPNTDPTSVSTQTMTFTLNVQPAGSAQVQFGDIDYVNETVAITGAQAPTSVDDALAWVTDSRLSISGLPADYLNSRDNWEYSDSTLKIKLTNALDSGDAGWVTADSQVQLSMTATPPNYTEVSGITTDIPTRPSAPQEADNSDPRAKGAGATGTVTMPALASGDTYAYRTAAASGGVAAGNWQNMSGATFSAVAGNYEVRTNGSASSQQFASLPGSVTIEQWYRVTVAVTAEDWRGNQGVDLYDAKVKDANGTDTDITIGQQIGVYGSASSALVNMDPSDPATQIDAVVNDDNRGWDDYGPTSTAPAGNVYASTYVPAGSYYQLPAFGADSNGNPVAGNWETPGYNLVRITQDKFNATAGDDGVIADASDAAYSATQSEAITEDNTVITLHFQERRFTVAWSVTKENTLTGTLGNLPTTQKVPWSEMVRTSLLGNMEASDFGTDAPNRLEDWFVGSPADVNAVHDPVNVSYSGSESAVRNTWALYINETSSTGAERFGFQVAQRMSRLGEYDPIHYMTTTESPDRVANKSQPKSWRDANTITFNTHYTPDQGMYGVRFKIAPEDQGTITLTNEDEYSRLSMSSSKGTPITAGVRVNTGGTQATEDQNTRIPGSSYIFSGWYVDPSSAGGENSAFVNDANKTEGTVHTGDFYNSSYRTDTTGTSGLKAPMVAWDVDNVDASQGYAQTTEGLLNTIFAPVLAVREYADSNVNSANRPFLISQPFWSDNADYADTSQYQNYQAHFSSGFSIANYNSSDPKTYPMESRLDVTARIENAGLSSTNTLPSVVTVDSASGSASRTNGAVTVSLAEAWNTTSIGGASIAAGMADNPTEANQYVSFRVTGVSQSGSQTPSGAGTWLTATAPSSETSAQGTSGLEIALETNQNLTPGAYSTTLVVTYSYTSSNGTVYDNLTTNIPISFQVGSSSVISPDGNWMAVAHDYVTTYDNASTDLGTVASIVTNMGLKVYHNTGTATDKIWEEVKFRDEGAAATEAGADYTVATDPEPWSGSGWTVTNGAQPVTFTITPHINTEDGSGGITSTNEQSFDHNRNQVFFFDEGGIVTDDIAVFANNKDWTLPEKDANYTSSANDVAALVALMNVTAYNVSSGYIKIENPSFTISNDNGLTAAGPDNVRQDDAIGTEGQYDVTFVYNGATSTAQVTLVKADYPGAPGAFDRATAGSSASSLAWSAAPANANVSNVSAAYAPQVAYRVEGPSGTVVGTVTDGTSISSLASNTEYVVKAYHDTTTGDASKVYHSFDWATAEAATHYSTIGAGSAWTNPANPNLSTYGLDVVYDYAAETVKYTNSNGDVTMPTTVNEGTQANGSAAEVTVSSTLAAGSLADQTIGVQEVTRGDISGSGSNSGTFAITAVGTQSNLGASGAHTETLPQRAQTPSLSIQQPAVQGSPAIVYGFDPEYVSASGSNNTYGTQYQVRLAGENTWGSIDVWISGTAQITEGGTISVVETNNRYEFQIPSTFEGTLEFRVAPGTSEFESQSTLPAYNSGDRSGVVPAHFASAVQSEPVNGGSFSVGAGARLQASNFEVGLDELAAWGYGTGSFDISSFSAAAFERSNPNIANQQAGQDVALDESSISIQATEGTFTDAVTWNMVDAAGATLSSLAVDVTVTSSYSPGVDGAWLSANNFVVGLSEVTDWAGLTQLAWNRSGAHGANTEGAELTADDITFTVDGVTDLANLTPSASPYAVHFVNTEMGLDASVQMYVSDNIEVGTDWMITSNNFSAGENEVDGNQTNGELTEAAALARAGVQLFEVGTAATPVTATTTNVTVDISALEGATVAQSPIQGGATFEVVAEPGVIASSDVTITTSGSGSENGAYQLYASNVVTDVASLTANTNNGAALLYELAAVSGVNNNTPINANGYGSTWNVTMAPAGTTGLNSANPNASVEDKTTWTKGEYTLTFSLIESDTTADYTAMVSMTVSDKGGTGTVDGSTYYITSNNFEAGAADYATYFPSGNNPDYSALIGAADVRVYEQLANGTRVLVSDLTAAGLRIDVDASAVTETSFVAGATVGPVVFTLNNTAGTAENGPSTESMITVHGGYVEGDGFVLVAENFVIALADLKGVTPGTAITDLNNAFAAKAIADSRFTITPAGATNLVSVTPGITDTTFMSGVSYPVTFEVTDGTSVTVQMTVYDEVVIQGEYVMAANDFRASELEAGPASSPDSLGTQEIRERAKVAVFNASNLQTPILAWNSPGSKAAIAVNASNFRNHVAGQASSIVFTYTPSGVQATSNVDIYASGSAGEGAMSLYSNNIVARASEIPTTDAAVAAWLIAKAGVVGTSYDGLPITPQTDVTADINTIAGVVDGATVTFFYSEMVENEAGAMVTYTVQSKSAITIRDNGGEGTGTDGKVYGIYSNSINATVAEGALFSRSANNYQNLRNATGVVGYVKETPTSPARELTASEIVVDAAQAAALANAYAGANMDVAFTNGPSQTAVTEGTLPEEVTSTSTITFFSEGSSTDEYELYANDFKVGREQLTNAADAAAIEQLIRTGSSVVWGPTTGTDALRIEVAANPSSESTNWQSVTEFMAATSFDDWGATAYDIRFTYTGAAQNPSIVVTMSVASAYDQAGTAEVAASDFSVTAKEVNATINDYRAQLISWAGAQALDNKVAANDRMVVQLDGVTVAAGATKPTTWPSGKGNHEVTFSITEAVPTGEGGVAQTATVTVAMSVFDNGSTDPSDPEEPVNPNPGSTYKVVSNDFDLSLTEIQAGKDAAGNGFTEAFQSSLISRAGAKAYLLSNLAVESGTVYVYNADELLDADLAEGDTARISFGVREDEARSVSTVTIYASGGTDDNPNSKASIYANDVYTWKSAIANPSSAGFADHADMLLTLSGAKGTLTDGSAMTASDFAVSVMVDGAAQAPSADNLVNGATTRFTHDPAITLTTGATLAADVTLHVSDSGGEVTDPDTNTTYRMQSNNLSWLASNVDQLRDNTSNYGTLRVETNARATTQVEGQPEQLVDGADGTKLNVNASALGTEGTLPAGAYNVVFTNTASANVAYQPQSTSIVSLFDQGGVNPDSKDYLWANNFTATKTDLAAAMADIHDFIYGKASVSAGSEVTGEVQNTKDVSMNIVFGGTTIDLVAHYSDLASQPGFDNWARDSYQITLAYGTQTATVTMTVRDGGEGPGGGGLEDKASIYGDNFSVAQAFLAGQATTDALGSFLYGTKGAKITGTDITGAALPTTWDPNLVDITVNGASLQDALNAGWALGAYSVKFTIKTDANTVGTKSFTATMTVKEQVDVSEDGLIEIGANSFFVGVSLVRANEATRAQWIWDTAKTAGSLDGYALTYNNEAVSIMLNGTDITTATWPTTKGVYPITITVERAGMAAGTELAVGAGTAVATDATAQVVESADGANATTFAVGGLLGALVNGVAQLNTSDTATQAENNSVTVAVNMIVFDNSSTDPADGTLPEPVDDGVNDVLTRDFAVTVDELAAGASVLTNAELLSRSAAIVVGQDARETASSAVVVLDRSNLDTGTLKAGDTVQVSFQMEGGLAVATSNVTVFASGGTNPGDPNDPTDDSSIYSNDFIVGRNEVSSLQSLDTNGFVRELANRSGVVAMLNSTSVVPDASNVNVYVGGALVSTAADVNWNLDTQTVEFRLKNASGTELCTSRVKMHVRDSVVVGENGGVISANSFTTSRTTLATTAAADLPAKLFGLAQVMGTTAAGADLTAADVVVTVGSAAAGTSGGMPLADVTDWSANSYDLTFAVADDLTAAVTVTMHLRDAGVDPSTPGTVDPSDPNAGDEIASGAHASIYANHFAVDYLTGLEPSVDALGDFLYGQSGVVGTKTDGTDLTGSADVTITIGRTPVAVPSTGLAGTGAGAEDDDAVEDDATEDDVVEDDVTEGATEEDGIEDGEADDTTSSDASTGSNAAEGSGDTQATTALSVVASRDVSAAASPLAVSLLSAAPSTAIAAPIVPALNTANVAALGAATMSDGVALADVAAGMRDGSWQWQNGYYPISFSVAGAPNTTATVWMEVSGVAAQAADTPVAPSSPESTPQTGDGLTGLLLALVALGASAAVLAYLARRRFRFKDGE